MNSEANRTLYDLIRAYLHSLGTSRTTVVALKSYIDAVGRLKCTSADFRPMLARLNTVIKNTEPKVIPLVHLIEAFEAEMESFRESSLELEKKRAVDVLTQKLEHFETATATVTANCMNCIAPDDFIIVHSTTAYIRNALVRAHRELQRTFKVLALKQDFIRTKELVNDLAHYRVDHLLIPEYNLSHYLKSATKLFIGAVSVSSDNQAVTGVGTANVVSLCHWYHVPVYLFVESIKFAHKGLADQHIYDELQDRTEADFTFHLTTFSHDFVNLAMIDHLVTETGEIPNPAN
jgi:translation initiation factor 2B subunit (eIF-2B alpha/beta/delta family)